MKRLHPAVGGVLFLAGLGLFVVGIVDATADAPSGGRSRRGTDTPWLIFAGIGCSILGGILFSVGLSSGNRRHAAPPQFVPLPAHPRSPETSDRIDQLERIAALRDADVLSPAEFEAQTAKILRES